MELLHTIRQYTVTSGAAVVVIAILLIPPALLGTLVGYFLPENPWALVGSWVFFPAYVAVAHHVFKVEHESDKIVMGAMCLMTGLFGYMIGYIDIAPRFF